MSCPLRARYAVFVGSIIACFSVAGIAHAANVNAGGAMSTAINNVTFIDHGLYNESDSSAAAGAKSFTGSDGSLHTHAEVSSAAGRSGLRAYANARFEQTAAGGGANTYVLNAISSATAVWDDFMITGPAGETVQTSIRLHLGGLHIATSPNTASNAWRGGASAQIGVSVNGTTVGSGETGYITLDGAPVPVDPTGMLTGFDGSDVVTTPTFLVPVNVPFSVKLDLGAGAATQIRYSEAGTISALSNFGNTLTFAFDRDVFALPVGYTVNSVEAAVVNNTYVPEPPIPGDHNRDGTVDAADYVAWRKTDGTPSGYDAWRANFGQTTGSGSGASAIAAVPEPTTLALLVFVVAGCCLWRSRAA